MKTENFWRGMQVLIMIASLAFGIWQYIEKERYRITAEMAAGQAASMIGELFRLNAQLIIHKKNEASWAKERAELLETQKADRLQAEKYYQDAMIYKYETEKLKKQLDEIVIINMDDDEHLRFFREWTGQ
jgi:hypothetical protein